jgi:hypothetical protein
MIGRPLRFLSAPLAAFGAALLTRKARRRRRATLPARALIVSPRESTVISSDGSVRSVQTAELALPASDLERMWNAANLENFARTYWRFLTRATLGLVRVIYSEEDRRVVLIARPLTLLRFTAPDYELHEDYGRVTWWIRDGLLVARAGRDRQGRLSLQVTRRGAPTYGTARLRIEVEVSNFYPSILSGFSSFVYEATQSFVHELVTHAFLRSLATLELAESRVGRLAPTTDDSSDVDVDVQGTQLGSIVARGDSPDGS